MKLLTAEIIKKLEKSPLYATEKINVKPIIVKFFNPTGSGSWYVCEGEKQEDGDWLFFGFVDLLEKEWGYFTLSELQSVKGRFGLGIERDMYFDGMVANVNTNEISKAVSA
jgi:hypothetical protein